MNKHLLSILAIVVFSSFVKYSFTEIINALKSNDAAEVAQYFDNNVEIAVPGKTGSYNKSKAEMIINDFFKNNPVKGFKLIHQGENAGSQYCIGNLITGNGLYRTTIYTKQKGASQVIQELRFEN